MAVFWNGATVDMGNGQVRRSRRYAASNLALQADGPTEREIDELKILAAAARPYRPRQRS